MNIRVVEAEQSSTDTQDASSANRGSCHCLSGVPVAPTAQLMDKRKSNELETCKLKMQFQKEKIDELTTERDFLKEQLTSSEEESSNATSDSSSTASSSEEEKKQKRRKKKKGNERKSKKMEPKTRRRVQNPDQAVSR
ncbi:hypothetical protein N1851_018760 [Merluccius polli]|uniref:Uncharacterized protein n=1 Tax=Merluccius polli TaxID=89951 RepID=A0AA47MN37_MERPO|nr:hypothetical protein N1851_018760 [Merluccius polli]